MSKQQIIKQRLLSIILFIISTSFCCFVQNFLRIKNSNMNNYDVEKCGSIQKNLKKR